MAPSIKVRYFDIRGRAEPIRMILSYGKIPFVDDRISKEDWATIKPTTPLGQLPVLEIDGKPIPQSIPICRYLGKLANLSGNDDFDNLTIDVAVETLYDIQKLAKGIPGPKQSDESEKKNKAEFHFLLGKLEENIKKHGGYAASNKLTWADIVFIHIYESLTNTVGENVFDKYPAIQQLKKTVLSQEGIKDWINKRPESTQPNAKYDLKQDI